MHIHTLYIQYAVPLIKEKTSENTGVPGCERKSAAKHATASSKIDTDDLIRYRI